MRDPRAFIVVMKQFLKCSEINQYTQNTTEEELRDANTARWL